MLHLWCALSLVSCIFDVMHLCYYASLAGCIFGEVHIWCDASMVCWIFSALHLCCAASLVRGKFGELYIYCNISLMHSIFGAMYMHFWCLVWYALASLLCWIVGALRCNIRLQQAKPGRGGFLTLFNKETSAGDWGTIPCLVYLHFIYPSRSVYPRVPVYNN